MMRWVEFVAVSYPLKYLDWCRTFRICEFAQSYHWGRFIVFVGPEWWSIYGVNRAYTVGVQVCTPLASDFWLALSEKCCTVQELAMSNISRLTWVAHFLFTKLNNGLYHGLFPRTIFRCVDDAEGFRDAICTIERFWLWSFDKQECSQQTIGMYQVPLLDNLSIAHEWILVSTADYANHP